MAEGKARRRDWATIRIPQPLGVVGHAGSTVVVLHGLWRLRTRE